MKKKLRFSDVCNLEDHVLLSIEDGEYTEVTTVGDILDDVKGGRINKEYFDANICCYEEF